MEREEEERENQPQQRSEHKIQSNGENERPQGKEVGTRQGFLYGQLYSTTQ